MALTILGIAGFQLYWLRKAYEREERILERGTNIAFRETILSLQASKLKLDKMTIDNTPESISMKRRGGRERDEFGLLPEQKVIALISALNEKVKEAGKSVDVTILNKPDTAYKQNNLLKSRDKIIQFLHDVDSLQDSITVKEIKEAYDKRLDQQNINIPFTITRIQKNNPEKRAFNEVTIGFKNPITYRVALGNTIPYLIKRISAPILLSLFLVAFTIVSFTLLYNNLLRQRRLAEIKNEFISNITHELKTPIATVSVAIEALRSFSAGMDAQRTKEYLDISANELQRLSLLVDKVLKLSMFENKEIELKYEPLKMQTLVEEVTASMRLQFEKAGAWVTTRFEGDTNLQGDRLHLVSVIYNLVDNALKYSTSNPKIDVIVKGGGNGLSLLVADNGIGVPEEYKSKIFEKFFRIPTGNVHNAKGYGLGLSYVAHIVEQHKGSITVERSELGGSTFVVTLPK